MDCNCKNFHQELVFRFVDNELGQELKVAIHRHVADCPHCAQQEQFTRRFLMLVRERAGRQSAPSRLRDRILAGLRHHRGSVQ